MYIRQYFADALTPQESEAFNHLLHEEQLSVYHLDARSHEKRRKEMIKKGWLSSDPEVLGLLKNGADHFELSTAKRIMSESPEKVFLNLCPTCGSLPRTPRAGQCPSGHSWRDMRTAICVIHDVHMHPRHPKFLQMEVRVIEGEIVPDMLIDLAYLGLDGQPTIHNFVMNDSTSYLTLCPEKNEHRVALLQLTCPSTQLRLFAP